MKAFVVVFLLLLCGCFASEWNDFLSGKFKAERDGSKLFNHKNTRKNKLIRDTTYMEFKPLPCSAKVTYEVTDETGLVQGVFEKYGPNEVSSEWIKGANPIVTTSLRRADVKGEVPKADVEEDYRGFYMSVETAGDTCQIEDAYYFEDYRTLDPPFIETVVQMASFFPCLELTDATYKGKKCKRCLTELPKRSGGPNPYIYIKDGYFIGMEYGENYLYMEYDFTDTRKDMVISKNCNGEGLPTAVYSAPEKLSDCKTSLLTVKLKELPCSYAIKYNSSDYSGVYKKYGYNELNTYSYEGSTTVFSDLKRADIHNEMDPWSCLKFTASFDPECSVSDIYYCDNYTSPELTPVVVDNWKTEIVCDEMSETTYRNKKCTLCKFGVSPIKYNNNNPIGLTVSVTAYIKDGLVLGIDVWGDVEDYEFVFEDFRNDMVLNKTCTDGELPQAVYTPPEEVKNCGHEAKFNDDAGFSVSAAAAMIISMVMVSLISLF